MSILAPDYDRWLVAWESLISLSLDYDRETPKPWLYAPTHSDDGRDFSAYFRELEAPSFDEVETAIRERLSRGGWPQLSDRARYYAGVRVDTCLAFLHSLSTPDGFVACPCVPTARIVEWVLLEWWPKRGPEFLTYGESED
jgi:hypothetical protein